MYGNVLFPKESKINQNKKPKRQNAVLRLMRDLNEWEQCKKEFPCIEACPLDDNIMEWHCNICPDSGDFQNIVFHLIINFDETYPTRAPLVKLCTTIPHPNVFGGWICLDMIKRYDVGRYKGWTAAYSVTSILMQLQSFLFEQKTVDQMDYDGSRQRYFNQREFDSYYLPRIKSFKCDKCKHCWDKPFPITPIMKRRNGGDSRDSGVVAERKVDYNINYYFEERNSNDLNFCFWDGIYRDLEICIFQFFNVQDLLKLKRVAKRFQTLVFNTKIIQKDSIKCWFHRSATLTLSSGKENATTRMLCLGYGVIPTYFTNNSTTLYNQLFGPDTIRREIGNYEMIQSIDVTFDLLSSDAFDNFNIRKTVFNDRNFEHFLPLYLNDKHGKMALKQMDRFILKIFKDNNNNQNKQCHPWLKLLTVANCMKSLIVSVMQDSDNANGKLSLHYSVNVLETFFRLHHTLLAIYFNYKNEIGWLLQYQIDLFFEGDKYGNYFYRNKQNYPDMGIFLSYLTLWEKTGGVKWNDIAKGMLCETFTRQVKWVLNAHNDLVHPNSVSPSQRAKITWKQAKVSNRLFMFNTFFFKECCRLGEISLKTQFEQYNNNFGFPQDESLALKLQSFVKKISNNVNNYEEFYNVIGLKYPGTMKVGIMLKECMRVSQERGYHKPWHYGGVSTVAPGRERKARQEKETNAVVSFKSGIKTKVFKWGQQRKAKPTTPITTPARATATPAVRQRNGIARQASNIGSGMNVNMNVRQQQHQQRPRPSQERREVVPQARGELRQRNSGANERPSTNVTRTRRMAVESPPIVSSTGQIPATQGAPPKQQIQIQQQQQASHTNQTTMPSGRNIGEAISGSGRTGEFMARRQATNGMLHQLPGRGYTNIDGLVAPSRPVTRRMIGSTASRAQAQTQTFGANSSIIVSPDRFGGHRGYQAHQSYHVSQNAYVPIQVPMTPIVQLPSVQQWAIPNTMGTQSYQPSHYYNNSNSNNTWLNANNNNNNNNYVSVNRMNYGEFNNGSNVDDGNGTQRSILSTANSFASVVSESTDSGSGRFTNTNTNTHTDERVGRSVSVAHGMHNGAKPKRPPSIQNGDLVQSLLCESKKEKKEKIENDGPKAIAHWMHGGAIPKRPPILLSWVTDDDDENIETMINVNDVSKQGRKRHHRSRKRKVKKNEQ